MSVLVLWTKVNISVFLVFETVFPEQLSLVGVSAVTNHRLNTPGSDLVTSGSVVVSCIYAHISWRVSKSLFNVIQNIRDRVYIVNVGGRDTDIDYNVVLVSTVRCSL